MRNETQDFPYYQGHPAPLSKAGCLLVLAACAAGFAALLTLPHLVPGVAGGWVAAISFVVLQLAGLALAVGPAWKAIFRRPRLRELGIALACVPLMVIVPGGVAYILMDGANLVANTSIQAIGVMPPAQVANAMAVSSVQLLGEELVTILPFLVLLTILHRTGVKLRLALGISWIATALAFGALHLPTYGWNFGQALLVIGAARLVLTGVYILTRNIWASTITHVVNDLMGMALAVFAHMRLH
ncbi:CPBP family intramembrane glutamic endopeptidase [Stenotrophomonas sp. SY1]|uniref:CPBP family intramembrane glutamic endopeptidase n=1 Tax=Stenotrophomonas sp. SY1 TaxID=477235 RepID=UPI001E331F45|nr:CPBP family intramembrane glutamic endopeptidase [Stenotrophomonas sp. SY1]MCD9085206.1 CPBP family intramembrane metalloprotease [Stenotrophomonas sp. SY1]